MKYTILFATLLTMAGCATVKPVIPDTSRFPASTYAPYQVWVCRGEGNEKAMSAHYNALSTESVPQDQLDVINPRIKFLESTVAMTPEISASPCHCESVAIKSGATYFVDKSLYDVLPALDQSALQHDLALGGEITPVESMKTCAQPAAVK